MDFLKTIQNEAEWYDKTYGYGSRDKDAPKAQKPEGGLGLKDAWNTIQNEAKWYDKTYGYGSREKEAPKAQKKQLQKPDAGIDIREYSKLPGFEFDKPAITTLQNSTEQITYRGSDDEYVSLKQQWGDNPAVKAAADKRAGMAQAYRSGDPLAARPDALIPGSEAYMNTPDMKVWASMPGNKEAAASLRNKYLQSQDSQMARSGYTRGSGEIDRASVDASMETANGGLTNGPAGSKVSFEEDPTQTWKDLTGSETILDGQARDADLVKATQNSLAKYRNNEPVSRLGEALNGVGDLQEAEITKTVDQNPGVSRTQAQAMLQGDLPKPPRGKEVLARVGEDGDEVPDEAMDRAMERTGMQRNEAIDITRSEAPMDHLTLGERFANPVANRGASFMALQQPALRQAQYTGTRSDGRMQPPSGLNEAMPLKTSLKYQQGNIHSRADEDLQRISDTISADKFLWDVANGVGKNMFGPEYVPNRQRPLA